MNPQHPPLALAAAETAIVVHRADGSDIDLGVIAAHYADPERQAAWERDGRAAATSRIEAANAAAPDARED